MNKVKIKQTCLICKNELLDTDRRFVLAFEKPYVNIPIHFECFHSLKGSSYYTTLQSLSQEIWAYYRSN